MKFNLTKIALVLATASLLASTAHAAAPASVQLKFTGTVEKNTCTPSWTGQSVITNFEKVGMVVGGAGTPVSKTIPVNLTMKNCGQTGFTVTYNGDRDGNYFKNTGEQDVALKLTKPSDESVITPGLAIPYTPKGDGSVDFTVNSQLVLSKEVKDSSSVSGGTIDTIVTAAIAYQ
jgi:type 1 fimbria pilin